jgi:luciferase family oxidoreductase group 1
VSAALSLLDLALIGPAEAARAALERTVTVARRAESLGFRRVWYAEHHNMPSIASSATSVVITHVAAHTDTIRLGAGGVMLPNHPPLVVAEHYGTLETLHPGRIDLGLGRAPGTDPRTIQALRRDPRAADRFVEDVLELQGYLGDSSRIPGVHAVPGRGTHVPLYILGSSLYGASVAAALGLPYAFASHFAPADLEEAVALYRTRFQPSTQLDAPYVLAGCNVVVAETHQTALDRFVVTRRLRAARVLGGGRELTNDEADALLTSPAGQRVDEMLRCSAVGTPAEVGDELRRFAVRADADELIIVLGDPDRRTCVRSLELLAAGYEPTGA